MVRYKMTQVRPAIMLFPDDQGVIVDKPKGGCPFGFTKDDEPTGFEFPTLEQLQQF